jgi:hypothetical protein
MDNLSPVLRKLSGIAGRRRMEDEEFQDEAPLLDLSGLRPPPTNDYIPDPINGGTVPERYDVRANSVMVPVGNMPEMSSAGPSMNMGGGENEQGIGRQILRSLSGLAGSRIIDQLGEIPDMPSISERAMSGSNLWSDALRGSENIAKKSMNDAWSPLQPLGEGMIDSYPDQRLDLSKVPTDGLSQSLSKLQSLGEGMVGVPQTPEMSVSSQPEIASSPVVDPNIQRGAEIDASEPSPDRAEVIYGATDQVANSPELTAQFKAYTGVDLTPQMTEEATKYEKLIKDLDNPLSVMQGEYDEQMKAARARIEANQPNDMDKFYVGLALVMPAILGGLFGKEVGLASLGGGLQGLSKGMDNRQKALTTEADRMMNLNKGKADIAAKRGELELEKMKIPAKIREAVEKANPDQIEHLKGMKMAKFISRDGTEELEGFEVKPDLIAPTSALSNKHSLEHMQKEASEVAKTKSSAIQFTEAAHESAEILKQVKDRNKLSKLWDVVRSGKVVGEPMIINEQDYVMHKGKLVNPLVILRQNYNKMFQQYRQGYNIRTSDKDSLGDVAPDLIKEAINPQDAIDSLVNITDIFQLKAIEDAEAQGFYREPIEEVFAKKNRPFYESLNKKYAEKESDKIFQKLELTNAK